MRPQLTRRAALAAIATIPVTASAATASAPQHPLERLHDLHNEASQLMAAHNETFGGRWELRIRAADDRLPVIYRCLDAERPSPVQQLAAQHVEDAKAYCESVEVKTLQRKGANITDPVYRAAERVADAAQDVAYASFKRLLEVPCASFEDVKAKANALLFSFRTAYFAIDEEEAILILASLTSAPRPDLFAECMMAWSEAAPEAKQEALDIMRKAVLS